MPALIDTGAQRTVVSPAAIQRLGLKQTGTIRLAHVGGIEGDFALYAVVLRFPRAKLTSREIEITAIELAHPLVHCLLGRDVLSRWTFTYMGPAGTWGIGEDGEIDL